MARIFYGVSGTGFGHSSRAEVIGAHLLAQGHEVRFVGSLNSLARLRSRFPGRVARATGFHFSLRDSQVLLFDTLVNGISRGIAELESSRRLFAQIEGFAPDAVISDFEPYTVWWARRARVPCLAVDHQGVLIHLKTQTVRSDLMSRLSAITLTRGCYAGVAHHIVLSFFRAEVISPDALLVPPVVRTRVQRMNPWSGDHVVCYISAANLKDKLVEVFRQVPEVQFRIYGFDHEARRGNCRFLRTSTRGFLNDLAGCRAVVATAGFSLISECLHFRKPMLLLPLSRQYEQELNAHYVEALGLGMRWNEPAAGRLRDFLETPPRPYEDRVLRPDNRQALAAVDAKLALMLKTGHPDLTAHVLRQQGEPPCSSELRLRKVSAPNPSAMR